MSASAVHKGLGRAAEAFRASRWADAAKILDRLGPQVRELPEDSALHVRWLVASAEASRVLGGLARAQDLATRAVRAAEGGSLADELPHAHRVLGTVMWRAGELRAGRVLLERAMHEAQVRGDADAVVRCKVELSHICLELGLIDDADRCLLEAEEAAGDDPHLQLLPLPPRANLHQRRADRPAAKRIYEAALVRARAEGHLITEAGCLQGLANLALEEGDSKTAIDLVKKAHGTYVKTGYKHGEAQCYNAMGEAYRMMGDRARAAQAYERAVQSGDAVGNTWLLPRANLALLRMEAGRLDQARPLIEQVMQIAEDKGIRPLVVSMHVLLLPCVAEDDEDLRHHLVRASDGVVETGVFDRDLAWAAQLAAEATSSKVLKVRCRALALQQFEQLGDTPAADVERAMLGELARKRAPIPAGPFDLKSMLGEGAMGEVWRARHRLGFDAAVKVVAAASNQSRLLELLEGEARAVVGLDHPNIIRLMDFGTLDAAAEAMRPSLRKGAPWLAMELVKGDSLEDRCGTLPWEECRDLLLELLSALAHAHSRGVLHLDVKPANVLTTRDGGHAKLVDFGLAALLEQTGNNQVRVAGTPLYMAPEQIRGESWAWGPATDLYALGCLAVHLVTGVAPHTGPDLDAITQGHLRDEPVILLPPGVPAGFVKWCRKLLAKEADDRYRFAADAAAALRRIDGLDAEPGPTRSGRDRARSGLALFELRRPPLVGREAEREVLRDALSEVIATGSPRVVVLEGNAGIGKTALGRWIAEEAHAAGQASTMSAPDGAADPIGALISDRLRVHGLSFEKARRRIGRQERTLDETSVMALAAMASGEQPEGFRLDHALTALARLMAIDASDRPVILHVPASLVRYPGLLRLVERVRAMDIAVLVVCEVRPEELPSRGTELIEGAVKVEVDRLPDADLRAMLDAMLPLHSSLGVSLTRRAGGNPRLALHLLGSLVRHDDVAIRNGRVRLRIGVRLDLPRDLTAMWQERLQEVLHGLQEHAWVVLAVAALLGGRVSALQWRAACDAAGLSGRSLVLRRLRHARLATPTADRGFEFTHPILRDVIVEVARERGIYAEACRAVVASDAFENDPGRRGELLIDGGLYRQAVDPLRVGAERAHQDGDVVRALELYRKAEDALRSLGVAGDDPAWGELWVLRVRLAIEEAEIDDAEEWAERLLALAERRKLPLYRGRALRWLATIDWIARRVDDAVQGFQEAFEVFRELDEPVGQARALHGLAIIARARADYDEAIDKATRAIELLGSGHDAELITAVQCTIGDVRRRQGRYEESEQAFLRALELTATELQVATMRSTVLMGLGELYRRRGRLDEAEAMYREALALRSGGQKLRLVTAELNLALVELARGNFNEAEGRLNGLLQQLDSHDASAVVQWVRVGQLPILAARSDAAWKRALDQVSHVLEQVRLKDHDCAWCLELAGDRAREAGFEERAVYCYTASAAHWRAVGEAERAASVEARLG